MHHFSPPTTFNLDEAQNKVQRNTSNVFMRKSLNRSCTCSATSHEWLFVTPWTVAHQAPHGISQQEYWSGLPSPLQGILPNQRLNPCLLYGRWILDHWAIWELALKQLNGKKGHLKIWLPNQSTKFLVTDVKKSFERLIQSFSCDTISVLRSLKKDFWTDCCLPSRASDLHTEINATSLLPSQTCCFPYSLTQLKAPSSFQSFKLESKNILL